MPNITHIQLARLFETGATDDPLDEILVLIAQINKDVDPEFIQQIHVYIKDVFSGASPGFQASSTKYHNLRHTLSVVLAVIRLFHGLMLENHQFSPQVIEQALLAAYFHDTGLLLQTSETAHSGASYTKFHEARSVRFLNRYLDSCKAPISYHNNCAKIIKFTNLRIDPKTLKVPSDEIRLAGQILGSADILAQMAARDYLERLPFLYQENLLGGILEHASPLDLMRHTAQFYQNVIEKRLQETLGNISQSMRTHFLNRWRVDKDLYRENILKNIDYLNKTIARCPVEITCLEKYLRRLPPPEAY